MVDFCSTCTGLTVGAGMLGPHGLVPARRRPGAIPEPKRDDRGIPRLPAGDCDSPPLPEGQRFGPTFFHGLRKLREVPLEFVCRSWRDPDFRRGGVKREAGRLGLDKTIIEIRAVGAGAAYGAAR